MERQQRSPLISALPEFGAAPRAAGRLAMPPLCIGCRCDLEATRDLVRLCDACRRCFELPRGSICSRCAAPAPAASIGPHGCVHCATTPFHFQHVAALGVYRGPLQSYVLRMKSPARVAHALTAGRLLAEEIRRADWAQTFNMVTAPPQHWTRRLWHRTSAADLLAEVVADELKLPLRLGLLWTTRVVLRQATLTPNRRRHNLRGVFRVSPRHDVEGAHVLLIDDVLTTGTTANMIARVLRQAGAKTVSVGVVARGIGVD